MVFVVDKNGKPLNPRTERRARLLMERGRAQPIKTAPFVIKILDLEGEDLDVEPLTVKIDPGSKGTGISLVRESID
jgi:hypothetical protein